MILVVLTGTKPQRLHLEASLPEVCEANRPHAETVKKRKRMTKETAARKRERKENHNKACARAWREGVPLPSMPEFTEVEDSSTSRVDFSESDEFEVVTGASLPPAQRGAGVEASTMTLGERRLVPATPVMMPTARADRRSPTSVTGRRSPAPAMGWRSPAPAAGGGSPMSAAAAGRQTSASATPAGGRTSAASTEMP